MIEALDIQVKGIVQGVGFRPFIYRLARRYLITGWVLNSREGVFIHAEGEGKLLDEFVLEISDNPPAAAQVKEITLKEVPLQDCKGFEIRLSDEARTEESTLVSADLATCDDCLAELFDSSNRRYRYPFINCTNCGPRFTIIDGLPYDRPATSMAGFAMCPDCAREYADPTDRRFHAQPDACWECGPHISWEVAASACEEAAGAAEASPVHGSAPAPCSGEAPAQSGSEEVAGAAEASPVHGSAPAPCSGEAPAELANLQADSLKQSSVPLRPRCIAASQSTGEASAAPGTQWDMTRDESDAIFAEAVALLAAGGIVAVKGLGGFHLVCDAANADALQALRTRKKRDGKAFAVMVPDVDAARAYCQVNSAEAEQLMSAARPIVLLRKRADTVYAVGLADNLPELGVMLPATPVQHILIRDFQAATGRDMLVMTSGNVHDEPIVIDDDVARKTLLGRVADAMLGNNRPIRARYDDSVVRVLDMPGLNEDGRPSTAVQVIRRARGYAPVPLTMQKSNTKDINIQITNKTVFAAGSEQKNTFTYVNGERAFVSQHMGDLEDADVFDAWLDARACYARLFSLEPALLACDSHPEYLASKWAREQAQNHTLPLVEVQHHHAHIASVLGEHGLEGPVCGFAFDGTGYGADGAIWGGEVLLANQADYERFANFAYVPMPGGAAAIKNPLRMAYGVLWAFDLLEHPAAQPLLEKLGPAAQVCERMIDQGLNTPMTSSVGRLFDAASALLGVCDTPTYEGEAAILLDAIQQMNITEENMQNTHTIYQVEFSKGMAVPESTAHDTSVLIIDAAPVFRALLDDLAAGVAVPIIARRFHDAIVDAIVQLSAIVHAAYGISTVALSGGVFMNRYLAETTVARLGEAGFTVALNADLPPNDGCVSYGQAVVACATR